MTTKERILEEALHLFAQKGYKAVTVEEIAVKVGIKAPSLYKHYKSKGEIFSALSEISLSRYKEYISTISVSPDAIPSPDALGERMCSLLHYSLHDPYISGFRRIMTIEQFTSEENKNKYSNLYVTMMLDYHRNLFSLMMEKGLLANMDERELALIYDSPFILLLGECDRHPEKEEEAKEELRKHTSFFFSLFSPTKL